MPDAGATDTVLAAAGHDEQRTRKPRKPEHSGGLTNREVGVLRLPARGLTTPEITEQLFISPKTTDHHIQHVHTKIGVSTRAAAVLWAMQHAVVNWTTAPTVTDRTALRDRAHLWPRPWRSAASSRATGDRQHSNKGWVEWTH